MDLKIFNEYGLWMSIQKVEGHEKTLSEAYIKKYDDEQNMYSMFHAIWSQKLYFKGKYNRICLNVYYKITDEGTVDAVDNIKPFELSPPQKKKENQRSERLHQSS